MRVVVVPPDLYNTLGCKDPKYRSFICKSIGSLRCVTLCYNPEVVVVTCECSVAFSAMTQYSPLVTVGVHPQIHGFPE